MTRIAWTLLLTGSIVVACTYSKPRVDDTPVCGDNYVDPDETCDDGNKIDGDGCDSNCTESICGNGITAGEEECDDGNDDNNDDCTVDCKMTRCGDNRIQTSEECDDGNMVSGDGCDINCTFTGCGNGIITNNEECDDGNDAWYDDCSPECRVLTGMHQCGNGQVEDNEVCDDNNTNNNDECNATCTMRGVSTLFVGKPGQPGGVDGIGESARINGSQYMTLLGNKIFIANDETVRVIDIPTKEVKTIAGKEGNSQLVDADNGADARFDNLRGIATDGKTIWVSDADMHVIRAINMAPPHAVTTVAGVAEVSSDITTIKDDDADKARIGAGRGLTYYNGIVYFVEEGAHVLRGFDTVNKKVETFAGKAPESGYADGKGDAVRFNGPRHTASNGMGLIFIADTDGRRIRSYDVSSRDVNTVAGNGGCSYMDGDLSTAALHQPRGMAFDGESLYFVESDAYTIRQLDPAGQVSTLSGYRSDCSANCNCDWNSPAGTYVEGKPWEARWNSPYDVVWHAASRSLFVSDGRSYVIRRIE